MDNNNEIENYTLTDLQNEIVNEVREQIKHEDLENKGLLSRKMNIEQSLIHRVWYVIITRLIGGFSINIQLKRNGKVIFEYEIPKGSEK